VSVSPGEAAASDREAARRQAAYQKAINLAKIRIRLKNWKGAAEACEEALKAKPGDAEATRLMAEAKEHLSSARTLTLNLGGGVTMDLVYIKPGVFMMGGNQDKKLPWQGVEKPIHEVAITRGFYIGKYEVTQAQYEIIMGGNPSKWKEPNRPVEQVSWNEAVEFSRLATQRTRIQFRLPTEAEWEYACRAGSVGRYCFGSDETGLADYAWHRSNSGLQTHPVGQKRPNAWGLHDMHGNVCEWVADWYGVGYYANSPQENPTGPGAGTQRVLRGNMWGSLSDRCRSGIRIKANPSQRQDSYGFRVVVSVSAAQAGATSREEARKQAEYDSAIARAKMRSPSPGGWTDPRKARAEDPDFSVQGEYRSDTDGLHVVALGGGRFYAARLSGGLPGDGWDGRTVRPGRLDAAGVKRLVAGGRFRRVERKSATLGAKPPRGAKVLFDSARARESLSNWQNGRVTPDGLLMEGTKTSGQFGSCRLHIEFRLPYKPTTAPSSQDRGNSGVYAFNRYEMQLLDSFGLHFNHIDRDNKRSDKWKGVFQEHLGFWPKSGRTLWCGCFCYFNTPKVNMCYPPLAWQTYDIMFTAPKFRGDRKIASARFTVFHNGYKVHEDVELPRGTGGGGKGPEGAKECIYLQRYGKNPVRFRNIWIVETER
jgi:formylglycine-generating enzyme required for sulfatase activity